MSLNDCKTKPRNQMIISVLCLIAATTQLTRTPAFAESKPKTTEAQKKLRVAVYKSFTGSFGPGGRLKAMFEKSCDCELIWLTSEDAGSLFTDFVSGKMLKPDVIIGFDHTLTKRLEETDQLEAFKAKGAYRPQTESYVSPFQPIDYSYFAVMVDSSKVKEKPTSLASFLADSQFKKSFAAQDPRTSSPGFGLLAWIKSTAKDEGAAEQQLKLLGQQAISFTKGWSQSYGLLINGEAKAAFSYLTSELYHRLREKTDRYVALIFPDGHLIQVEYAAPVKDSPNKELSRSFMEFLHSKEAQVIIAEQNWMFPASQEAYDALPGEFRELEKKVTVKKVDPEVFSNQSRRLLIETWKRSLK